MVKIKPPDFININENTPRKKAMTVKTIIANLSKFRSLYRMFLNIDNKKAQVRNPKF
jgi:hypothetical protein